MVTHTEDQAQRILDAVNELGNLEEVAKIIASAHPTLQQSFMRLSMAFIRVEAEKNLAHQDGRNSATVQLAQLIKAKLPYEDFYGALPLI